jgi:amino acid transporter
MVVESAEKGIYIRKSSGLTKELGSFDSFSMALISLGPGPAFALYLAVLWLLPGTNLLYATLLGAVIGVPITAVYIYMSTKMPRSGGEYVFASRNMGTFWGIVSSVSRLVNASIYGGVLAVWFVTLSLVPALSATGFILNSAPLVNLANTLSTRANIIAVAEVLVVILALLYIFVKPKTAFRIFEVFLILELIGLIVTIVLLFAAGPAGFQSAFNALAVKNGFGSNYYQSVLSAGTKQGFVSGFSLSQTILFVPFIFAFYFMFITSPSYIAGEFTRSTRTIRAGTWIAYLLAFVFAVLIILAFVYAVGINFLNASVGLASTGSTAWKFTSLFPGLTTYPLVVANGNVVLIALIDLGSIAWYIAWLILGLYIFSRYTLAMSIDRLLPLGMSNVGKKSHSPYPGIIAVTVISMILIPVYEIFEGGFYGPLTYLLFILPMITVALTSVSAAFYGIHNKDVRGIVIGIIATVVTLVSAVVLSFLPTIGLVAGTTPSDISDIIIVGIFVVSLVWYAVLRSYFRRKHGLDIRAIFKPLPPD